MNGTGRMWEFRLFGEGLYCQASTDRAGAGASFTNWGGLGEIDTAGCRLSLPAANAAMNTGLGSGRHHRLH
jgi:hypothetical protein